MNGAPAPVDPALAPASGRADWPFWLALVLLGGVYVVLIAAFGPPLTALEEMGRSQGLGTLARFRLVTVPAVRPTLAAAAFLGFLVSWSEYGSSLAVGGGRPMLPVVLLPFVRSDPQVASAISLLFLAPAIAALLIASRASRSPL